MTNQTQILLFIILILLIIYPMGNKSNIQCAIRTDKTFYYPGQVVNCSVYINSAKAFPCSKLVIHIFGIEKSQFRVDGNVGSVPITGMNILIDTNFIIHQWSTNNFLQGQYQFPCQFRLPNYLPGSFKEEKSTYKANIRYNLKAIVVSGNKDYQHVESQLQMVVRQPQKEYDKILYGQTFLYPKCLFWRKLGVARVCCYVQKNNYQPGDECIIICEVDNIKSERQVSRVRCEFIKTITVKAFNGVQKVFHQTINTVEFPGAPRGKGYQGQNAQKKSFPLRYKNTMNIIHPTTSGQIVKCEYSINVKPQLGGCFTKGSQEFSVKVSILQQELKQNLQQPANWNPQVYHRSQILLNYGQDKQNDLLSSIMEQ